MKRIFLITQLIFMLLPALWAADTLTIGQKVQHTIMPSDWLRVQVWQNPAMNYHYRDFALSSLSINGLYEKRGEAALTQQGNGCQYGNLDVESFLPLSENNKVFGRAGYRNGKERNLLWNENDDFELLYPYFTGDSIGGDLKKEEYYFMGGYAHQMGLWTLGVRLDYRASISYRQRDPRPKNVTSDLNVAVGATRRLTDAYLLGLGVNVRNYDQKSEIDFFADQGSTSVYHLLGLGVDYVRFAGSQYDAIYNGWGAGGSIDLLPVKCSGLSLSLAANYFNFVKELSSINYAPIVEMARKSFTLEGVWLKQGVNEYAVKLNAGYEMRDGTENIFGDPTGNVYPIISNNKQYTDRMMKASLSTVVARSPEVGKLGWILIPCVGYWSMTSDYKSAVRSMEIANATSGVDANLMLRTTNTLWVFGFKGGYTTNLIGNSLFAGLNGNNSIGNALLSDFTYFCDDWFDIDLNIRGDYFLKDNRSIFAKAGWLHQAYSKSGVTNRWQASIGCVF